MKSTGVKLFIYGALFLSLNLEASESTHSLRARDSGRPIPADLEETYVITQNNKTYSICCNLSDSEGNSSYKRTECAWSNFDYSTQEYLAYRVNFFNSTTSRCCLQQNQSANGGPWSFASRALPNKCEEDQPARVHENTSTKIQAPVAKKVRIPQLDERAKSGWSSAKRLKQIQDDLQSLQETADAALQNSVNLEELAEKIQRIEMHLEALPSYHKRTREILNEARREAKSFLASLEK
jgi:hypothetical protein